MRKNLSVLLGLGLLCAASAHAEQVSVPIVASYALLQQVMQQELFKSPEHKAVFAVDKAGCTSVSFANPQLSGADALLQVQAEVEVKMGFATAPGRCSVLQKLSGSTRLKGAPQVMADNPLALKFQVVEAQVYDANGRQLNGGLVQQALQGQLRPLLDQFVLDLRPTVVRAQTLLPPVVHGYSSAQINQVLKSVRLGPVTLDAHGLTLGLLLQALPPSTVQGALQQAQQAQGLPKLAAWDSALSMLVKQMSSQTRSPEVREALLEVLQDARMQWQGGANAVAAGEDPFKRVFMSSWDRLTPLARNMVGPQAQQQELVALLAYVSANDVFATLESLARALGVDISGPGLLQLVQLMQV